MKEISLQLLINLSSSSSRGTAGCRDERYVVTGRTDNGSRWQIALVNFPQLYT